MTVEAALTAIQSASVVGILAMILWAGARRWWVYGHVYDDKVEECHQWRELALAGTALAERLTALHPNTRDRRG